MPDESMLGLLLRVHAQVAAQAHGEEFIHHNAPAMQCFETMRHSIEAAIRSLSMAEMYQRTQEAVRSAEKAKKVTA